MTFKYSSNPNLEVKWFSFPQKKISGTRILDRFEWDNFMIYHTDEDIHFFREPPAAIFDEKHFTEYSLVSTKNQSVTFKEEKLLGVVPFGKTIEELSLLTYNSSMTEDMLSNGGELINKNYPIIQ